MMTEMLMVVKVLTFFSGFEVDMEGDSSETRNQSQTINHSHAVSTSEVSDQ